MALRSSPNVVVVGPTLVLEQLGDASFDLFSNFAHALDRLAFGVFEGPSMRRMPGTCGHCSPQPMVIRIAESWASSSVICAEPRLRARCRPRASLEDLGVHARARLGARRDRVCFGFVGEGVKPSCGHLRPASIVNAREEYGFHADSFSVLAASTAGPRPWCLERAPEIGRAPSLRRAPAICAAMKPGASAGRIPEKVLVSERAKVTAGFANDVDAVNQYAAVM